MVKKWIFRVLALAVVVFFMLQTKKLFDNIKHGAFSIKSLEELESAPLVISDDKNTISSDKPKEESKPASQEEPKEEPEIVYEPSTKTGDDFYLDLSSIKRWGSGEYDKETGLKAEHKRRLRYSELIAIECPKYNIVLSEDIKLRICEYTSDGNLIRYVECVNGDTFEATSEGEFFSITLMKIEKEKTMSPGQWGRRFDEGIKVIICTDKWLDYSGEEEGNLVTGSYNANANPDLTELLLSGKDDELADAIWYCQIENDIYGVTGTVLNNGNQTYYFSTSEGDDNNSGLSRDNPKKNVEAFSGMSNVNLLLKCGDTFKMTEEFKLGNNCIYAAYGQGRRPVLSFYRDLDVRFTQSKGVTNIWEADLSSLEIATGKTNKQNCNMGQLVRDGVVNWKRNVWSSKEDYNPSVLDERQDGAWAVDWDTSKLYLNSETDPNKSKFEYAPPLYALSGEGIENVLIAGLEVKGAGRHGLNIENGKNVEVRCCYIDNIGGCIHASTSMRYGNAVQVWNSGTDINIHNNVVSWAFDTCFTNQGKDNDSVLEHVYFTDNLGSHFYWGIETWGVDYGDDPKNDVAYLGNVLYDNIDLTNPTTPMQAGVQGKPLRTKNSDYISYRTGYRYHQMSGIDICNSKTGPKTRVEGNVVWNTNRLLVLASNLREEEPMTELKNNFLYSENALKNACLMRYGKRTYCKGNEYLDSSNIWSVHYEGEEFDRSVDIERLHNAISRIAGKR